MEVTTSTYMLINVTTLQLLSLDLAVWMDGGKVNVSGLA